MGERLLSLDEASERLAISRRQFYRLRARLIDRGLQEIRVGHRRKYRETSLDQLIGRAAANGYL